MLRVGVSNCIAGVTKCGLGGVCAGGVIEWGVWCRVREREARVGREEETKCVCTFKAVVVVVVLVVMSMVIVGEVGW